MSERIDQGPRELFHEGTILLLRCSWLLDHPDEKVTGTRRQEMPAEAYFPPDEAADLFGKGDRSVLALSYPWHSSSDPDPTGSTDAAVRRYLASLGEAARGLALFCDFACLPQTVTMTAHTIFIASRKHNASKNPPPTAAAADDECRLTITHHRQRAEKSRVRVDSLALLRHGGSPAVPCAASP